MQRYKVSAVDQMRTPDRALILAGPVDVPSGDDIRSALAKIARIGPQTRIGLRSDSSRRRWRRLRISRILQLQCSMPI